MLTQKRLFSGISLALAATLCLGASSCNATLKEADLMNGVVFKSAEGKLLDDKFVKPAADFSVKLFQQSIDKDANSMVSPLSVMLALSMTANGAKNNTLAEMEKTLGGENSISELNKYLLSLSESLESDDNKAKFSIANSIWFKDENFNVDPEFLETNSQYYDASLYKLKFDDKAKTAINSWVDEKTFGMIDKIIDEINPDAVMYLINAIAFDAEWRNIYQENQINDGDFTDYKGNKKTVKMMSGSEYSYIDDGKATGFIKPYAGDEFSFVALLPNEGTSIDDYISSMTGDGFVTAVSSAEQTKVITKLPKFKYEYGLSLNDALSALGINDAFDPENADFTALGTVEGENIFINNVIHKTYIEVDERGTRAGAVTAVEMNATSALVEEPKSVILDRPFVYAIVDNETSLPIFIGTVLEIK